MSSLSLCRVATYVAIDNTRHEMNDPYGIAENV